MSVRLFDFCTVPGCGRRHDALGLCMSHYKRLKNKGKVEASKPIGGDRKLNMEKAREMRKLYAESEKYFCERLRRRRPTVSVDGLALKYGVTRGTVQRVLKGLYYAE